jgi:hypothetical protein
MAKKITLDDIFDDDDFGILNTKAKTSNLKSDNERLIDSFREIVDFFEKYGRLPEEKNVTEFKLQARLKSLNNDENKKSILKPYDNHNLLNHPEEIKSVSDIFDDDDLGLLDTDETLSIFNLKNVTSSKDREEADFVARRKPIKDFEQYEKIFQKVHQELKEGKRKFVEFKEDNLRENTFYVLDGILLYLEKADIEAKRKIVSSGVQTRKDGRTKTIFENGTESDMFYRSLYKALSANGMAITHNADNYNLDLAKNSNLLMEEDLETGWVYILKSKSQNPVIANIDNLYKIGFSKVEIKERIKNASKEPTYLMADVHVVSAYKCYNFDPHKFEQLLHRFFAKVCLDVDIHDDKGRRITPREWFIAPLNVIDEAIQLTLSGDIVNYEYDTKFLQILKTGRL